MLDGAGAGNGEVVMRRYKKGARAGDHLCWS
jgi:hypothetical protein